jgi:DNA-binding transcriptional LysR family regulator
MQSRNPLEVNILIVTIAQEGSFERTSKKLGMAPPSLTRRVAWLERNIGVKLFGRSTRNVELTAAGRLFVQESSLSLNYAERAWDLARFQAQIDSGPYRVGPLASTRPIPPSSSRAKDASGKRLLFLFVITDFRFCIGLRRTNCESYFP